MTNTLIRNYTTSLCLAVLMAGIAISYASAEGGDAKPSDPSQTSEVTGTLSSDTSTKSEVTGTISSDTSSDSETAGDIGGAVASDSENSGNLAGTVSSESDTDGNLSGTVSGASTRSSGGSGGSRSSGGVAGSGGTSDDSTTEPSGAVLGVAAEQTQTPGFPNAGTAPKGSSTNHPLWSAVKNFLTHILPF